MTIIRKYARNYNKYTELYIDDNFEMEVNSLKSIRDTYKCTCSNKVHFPMIVDYNENDHYIDMSNCGVSINNMSKDDIKHMKENLKDLYAQVACIILNLQRANIYHVDCPNNGQNLCWNKHNKCLSLIDFDAVISGEKTSNPTLIRWKAQYGSTRKEYNALYGNKIYNVISRFIKDEDNIDGKTGAIMSIFERIFGKTDDEYFIELKRQEELSSKDASEKVDEDVKIDVATNKWSAGNGLETFADRIRRKNAEKARFKDNGQTIRERMRNINKQQHTIEQEDQTSISMFGARGDRIVKYDGDLFSRTDDNGMVDNNDADLTDSPMKEEHHIKGQEDPNQLNVLSGGKIVRKFR